jgi:hypothetical protein
MEKIFIVTSGGFGELNNEAVFDNLDFAEQYIKMFHYDEEDFMTIHEIALNPFKEERELGLKYFTVRMSKELNLIDVEQNESYYNVEQFRYMKYKEVMIVKHHVFAKDIKHAIELTKIKINQDINKK